MVFHIPLAPTGKFCRHNCTETTYCSHYNWSPSNGGTCELRFGVINKNNASIGASVNVECGLAQVPIGLEGRGLNWFKASSGGVWANGCDYKTGSKLKSVQDLDEDECLGQCAMTQGELLLMGLDMVLAPREKSR